MIPREIAVILVIFLLFGTTIALAKPGELGRDDHTLLTTYASDTWRSIAALTERGVLPADSLRKTENGWVDSSVTSPTNIAAYLWSTVAAEDLSLIGRDEAGRRLGQALTVLRGMERAHGFYFNWYDSRTGERTRAWPGGGLIRPFLSSVDNGWLAAALMIVGKARPEFRDTTDAILGAMNFRFFYNPFASSDPSAHPGLLYGGFWTDDGSYSNFHYEMLNTEPRIASYIGIARGELPAEHYYRMSRASATRPGVTTRTYAGVPVAEGSQCYRGMRVVPSWDGTMFEALMVGLFVPEDDWAPQSWGRNHPLYVRAQIEYGLRDTKLGYWGFSAACDPAGGYRAFGVAGLSSLGATGRGPNGREAVVTPHAAFLALPFAPREALANLRALAAGFPVYGPYGFFDSVDVITGRVSDSVLVLDQAMILAAIDHAIGANVLRRSFCSGAVEAAVRPLIAPERFDVGIGAPAPLPTAIIGASLLAETSEDWAALLRSPVTREPASGWWLGEDRPGRAATPGRSFLSGWPSRAGADRVSARGRAAQASEFLGHPAH
jgi:hypothetical protein